MTQLSKQWDAHKSEMTAANHFHTGLLCISLSIICLAYVHVLAELEEP